MNLTRGHYQAFWAYFTWGVFPIYWKFLKHISSTEILFHRIIWGAIFLGVLVFAYKRSNPVFVFSLLKRYFFYVLSLALLIAGNWYIYVYAVNTGQILQGSLAYFITPLLNIVLGSYVFEEKLSSGMKLAALIAAIGVFILILLNTTFPWIALSLACTFSFYGVLKKKIQLGGLESSFLESFIMLAPAAALAIAYREISQTSFSSLDWALMVGGGIVTAVPILLFSLAARSVPYNHMGILQFLAPTLQFLCGFAIYGEEVTTTRWMAFACVWFGAGLYLREIFRQAKPVK